MRNTILTASFIKDILDFSNKYHLTDITINNKYELHCDNGYRLKDKITGNKVEDSYSEYIKYLEDDLKNIPEDNVDKNYSKVILEGILKRSKEFLKKVIDK